MEPELKINIFQFIGTSTPDGRTSDHGNGADDLRKYILGNWSKYQKIIISFDGIVKMTRVFMDEGFAKLLEEHTLDDFNKKIFFPDAKEAMVKELNSAFKLRMKIRSAKLEREDI